MGKGLSSGPPDYKTRRAHPKSLGRANTVAGAVRLAAMCDVVVTERKYRSFLLVCILTLLKRVLLS